MYSDAV